MYSTVQRAAYVRSCGPTGDEARLVIGMANLVRIADYRFGWQVTQFKATKMHEPGSGDDPSQGPDGTEKRK